MLFVDLFEYLILVSVVAGVLLVQIAYMLLFGIVCCSGFVGGCCLFVGFRWIWLWLFDCIWVWFVGLRWFCVFGGWFLAVFCFGVVWWLDLRVFDCLVCVIW